MVKISWLYRKFHFKLSVAIPIAITILVGVTGIVFLSSATGIIAGLTINPKDSFRVAQGISLMTLFYFAVVILAFIVGILLSYTITRSINKLTKKAADIAAGTFVYEQEVIGYGELGALEKMLNKASRALQKTRRNFEEHIHFLERRLDDDKIADIVASRKDVAMENTKVYARLKELDRLKSDFISNVSHELRTPLTAIKEGADLILDKSFGELNSKQLSLINIINRNSQRLTALINDLLDLSRLESGKIDFITEAMNIATLAQDAINGVRIQASNKRVKIEINFPAGLPKVLIDRERTMQVFTNLLGNAIKFTPPEGWIKVSAVVNQNKVEIAVANSGTPIPADKLEAIFDKFYQLGRGDGSLSRGTGLGLSIVREIVKGQGGKVWAESEPGMNRFIFSVPIFRG